MVEAAIFFLIILGYAGAGIFSGESMKTKHWVILIVIAAVIAGAAWLLKMNAMFQ